MNAQDALGPVQLLLLEFDGDNFEGKIMEELQRLADKDIVRLLDLLFVSKDEDGNVTALEASALGLEGAPEGAIAGALIGLGQDGGGDQEAPGREEASLDPDQVWYADDEIPPGTAAAIVLLEHRWAIPLREATQSAHGELLAEAWVHPLDLTAVGLDAPGA